MLIANNKSQWKLPNLQHHFDWTSIIAYLISGCDKICDDTWDVHLCYNQPINPRKVMRRITNEVNLIVEQLRLGHVVALPTETVYGLGADATNEIAIQNVFKIKARPINHPLIMHVSNAWDLRQWVENIPAYASILMKAIWPGPLTLVFKLNKKANLSPFITGNQETIAIRCPKHPLALEVLNKLGHPIVLPSANPFGKVSPTEASHVMRDFPNHDFLILEGGACDIGIESTILYAVNADDCRIIRHGIISPTEIEHIAGPILEPNSKPPALRISGNLKQHYQPEKPLFYFYKEDAPLIETMLLRHNKPYVLCFSVLFDKQQANYTFPCCPRKAAQEFYRQVRVADASEKDGILIELPPSEPEWEGLIDRIKKAGTYFNLNSAVES